VYRNYSVSMVAVVSAPALLLAIASLAATCSAFVTDQRCRPQHRFSSLDLRLAAASSGGGGLLGFIGGSSTKVPRNGNEKYVVGLVRERVSLMFRLMCISSSATFCAL
jgi:hypothetical protein